MQRAHEVRIEEPRRLGRVRLHQRHEREVSGVVDEDVERAEALDRRGDDPLAVRRVAHVRRDDENRRAARLLDRRCGVGQRIFRAPDDGDPGALAGEGARNGEADPRPSPGHDRDLAGERAPA